jgi:pimeloyl-ACP methyl ester carboxylesterase
LNPAARRTHLARALVLAVFAAVGLTMACGSSPPPGHYAELRGIRMYYELYGHGTPLVLLHGGLGDGRQFSHQIPEFSKHFQLIVPDLRAQGRTTDGPDSLTYHEEAEDVIALMDRLNVRDADVMGWSDGGIDGLDMAIHHPDRVRHLVTFGANFTPDGLMPEDVAWNQTATAESLGPDMKAAYQRSAPDPSHFEVAMNRVLNLWRTQPNFTMAELGSIRARTLIAAGEHDLIRPEHSRALAAAIPGAHLWFVPGASHGAMIEKPEIVNPKVLAFLLDRPL